jgi:hypothetical protein
MVKCGVLFQASNEFLDIIQTSYGFNGLSGILTHNFSIHAFKVYASDRGFTGTDLISNH